MCEKWLRPLSFGEVQMELYHQEGCNITSYFLTLNFASPLQVSNLHQALVHLYRKVPILRCSIKNREEEDNLWFVEMPEEVIDLQLQVLGDMDQIKVHESIMTHNFDVAKGPLWCVRLITAQKDTLCPLPDVGQTHPHQYYLVIGLHHAISDGSSTMRTLGLFTAILNDVIIGNAVNDAEQLAEHVGPYELEEIIENMAEEMQRRPEYLKTCKETYMKITANKPLLFEAYPQPKGEAPQTLTITSDLDEVTTALFLKKCRAEGVTFHTALTAVCNVAIIDLLVEKGLENDSYRISVSHAINMRRYWTKTKKSGLGLHIWMMKFFMDTPRDSARDFWVYAKKLHEEFYKCLSDNSIFHQQYVSQVIMEELKENPNINQENFPNELCYMTTNMGIIDDYFPMGQGVQVTHVVRSTSINKFQTIWTLATHTFPGRLLCGVNYKSTSISRDGSSLHGKGIRISQDTLLKT